MYHIQLNISEAIRNILRVKTACIYRILKIYLCALVFQRAMCVHMLFKRTYTRTELPEWPMCGVDVQYSLRIRSLLWKVVALSTYMSCS